MRFQRMVILLSFLFGFFFTAFLSQANHRRLMRAAEQNHKEVIRLEREYQDRLFAKSPAGRASGKIVP